MSEEFRRRWEAERERREIAELEALTRLLIALFSWSGAGPERRSLIDYVKAEEVSLDPISDESKSDSG